MAERVAALCVGQWPLLATLPHEVVVHLLLHVLDTKARVAVVRACLPRTTTLSRWWHGSRNLYALGFQTRPVLDCGTMGLAHVFVLRGKLHDVHTLEEVRDDGQTVGPLFLALRALLRARDAGQCRVDLYERFKGFRSLERWHERLVALLYA
jgi:hypothetical protein